MSYYQGVIDATQYKYSCMQPFGGKISEDCLYLNIWTQSGQVNYEELKPVMFWIHGAALSGGTIFDPDFLGGVLATEDVVLVTVNYRVGAFGFLYTDDSTTPGNAGFYDQNLALEWVRP